MEPARVSAPASAAVPRNLSASFALLLILLAFAAYTALVIVDYGVIGFVEAVSDNTAVMQVGLDLVIAIAIALGFVYGDAKRRGLPFVPYLIATVFLGSIGLLAYLFHRTWRGRATSIDLT
jgi:hypothetical protein